jgi:hypothetical protein
MARRLLFLAAVTAVTDQSTEKRIPGLMAKAARLAVPRGRAQLEGGFRDAMWLASTREEVFPVEYR